ncbi:MAG: LamG domain-containing protein [Lentisphaeria bacterium]|nr:LamG domain-containing protein [Lentisphaeria bacterium]
MKLFTAVFAAILGTASLFAADPDPSLVLHLKFDEGEGTLVKDATGKGHDAKLTNCQWVKFGVRGSAIELNGKDSFVDIPWSKDLDLPEEFTYSLWFKFFKTGKGQSLFNRGNYTFGFQSYIYDSFVSFHSLKVKGRSLIYTRFVYADRPEAPFYHLVITSTKGEKEGERIVRFFVNGKQRTNDKRFGGQKDFVVNGPIPVEKKVGLTIGKFASHEGQWFKGIIDEAKVYSRPLTEKEIKEEYDRLSVPEEPADVKKKN